ncbi:MAG: hypothetical protein JSS86_17805 [Cyanobacteria bacterium SZAS LIN-2]|nr:hypothetical protein [Cyanobacteria bacterium SZAS LIN-2]
MNDLNENFSGNEQGQAQRRDSDHAPGARSVLSPSASPSADAAAEAMESAGPCQNGVCSLTWKPLRPAA